MRTVVLGGYTGVVVTTGATVEESLKKNLLFNCFLRIAYAPSGLESQPPHTASLPAYEINGAVAM